MTDNSTVIDAGIHPEDESPRNRRVGGQLFALSFASLFLELMLIRWVPAVVAVVAYYANLMLISSFLGLGLGAMMARRRSAQFWTFPILLLIDVALLLACAYVVLPGSNSEARFSQPQPVAPALAYTVLVLIFSCNTLLFVPLGKKIGELFNQVPPLQAYSWDLGGSLAGTVTFGLFSLYHFSALIGLGIVMAIYFVIADARGRKIGAALFPIVLLGAFFGTSPHAIWSPYYYITVARMAPDWPSVSEPAPNLRTMHDPPAYWIRVGRDFYQRDATLELSRYTPETFDWKWISEVRPDYFLPYQIARGRDNVAVMGAGGGVDVQAALMNGVRHVDAVEIDPTLVGIARRFNSSGVYDDPRVSIHIDDARAHMRAMRGGYDVIVFGFLDSQALFSYMANLRLDGYIYTVQSMRSAFERLGPDGVLSLSFYCVKDWLPTKLIAMVHEATGAEPIVYTNMKGTVLLLVTKGNHNPPPDEYDGLTRMKIENLPAIAVPTDDWPYLYLSKRTIPSDYAIVIAILLTISIAGVLLVRGRAIHSGVGFDRSDGHFFFMGLGFLLMQTKSITDCSLYFGTTWLVTTIVIAGILLMVLAANLLAMRLRSASRWLYLPLFTSLIFLYVVPRDWVLGEPFVFRLGWALLIVPLPIFFAGLIFSTTFRESRDRSTSFGSNLIGATIGGFCEYLGMALGMHALSLIVMAAYLGSLLCRTRRSARSSG